MELVSDFPDQRNVLYSELLFVLFVLRAVYFMSPHKTKIGQSLYIPLTWILITRMFKPLFINYFVTYRRAWTNDVIIGWNSFPTWSWCRTATHCYQLDWPYPITNFSFHFSIFSFFGLFEKSKKSRNLHPKSLSWVADLKMTHSISRWLIQPPIQLAEWTSIVLVVKQKNWINMSRRPKE